MRMNLWMLCLATSLAVAATAEAQPGGVGGGGRGGIGGFGGGDVGVAGIAGNEAVQKELGLSAEATDKVKAVLEEFNTAIREAMTSWRSGFGDFRDMTQEERTRAMAKMVETVRATSDKFLPKLKEVLTADQFTRLQQIHWQSMGIAALSDPEIVKAIPISKDQQDKIKSINTEYAAKRVQYFTGGGGSIDRPDALAFAKMQEQNREQDKEREAKITEILTKDQQDKFASLKGKEFDLSQLRGFVGGGRGGPGGGGNGGRPKLPQPEVQ